MYWLDRMWEGCGHCSGEDACPRLQQAAVSYAAHAWLRGRTLVLLAVTIFWQPLALGVGGAWLAGRWAATDVRPLAQLGGLLAGLLIGGFIARAVVLTAWRRGWLGETSQAESQSTSEASCSQA